MILSLTRVLHTNHPRRTPRPSLMRYLEVWQQRRALANMSPDRLDDLGISRAEAAKEVARPFWEIPERYR